MKSLKMNFIYNIAYQLLVILLPLVTAPYVSRTLGAEGLGVFSYTHSVVYYFQLFAMLGISNHGNRSIATARNDSGAVSKVFCEIYSIQISTFVIASAAYLIYVLCGNIDNKLIAMIQLVYLCSGILDISWLFFGMEEFKLTVTRNTIIKIFTTVAVFIVVKSPADVWKYTLILAGGTFLSQLYLWSYVKRYVSFCFVSWHDVKRHIQPILVLFIPVIAYSLYKVMDKIMLGRMCTYQEVGYYQNAEKIINIPMGIITALGTVMLPRMTNLIAQGDDNTANNYITLSFKVVTLIGSAISFGMLGVSSIFSPVFFGQGYDPCVNLIRVLSITVLFMAWANVLRTQYLIPKHKDKIYVVSTFVGAILNLFVNYMLIPKLYSLGAAIGTVVAEFSVLVTQILMLKNEYKATRQIVIQSWYIIAGGLMCGIVYYLSSIFNEDILSLVVLIVIGGTIYSLSIGAYSFVIKDEIYTFIIRGFKSVVKCLNSFKK